MVQYTLDGLDIFFYRTTFILRRVNTVHEIFPLLFINTNSLEWLNIWVLCSSRCHTGWEMGVSNLLAQAVRGPNMTAGCVLLQLVHLSSPRVLAPSPPHLSAPFPPALFVNLMTTNHAALSIYSVCAKPREVPTDESQSAGLYLVQAIGFLKGVGVFDLEQLDSSCIRTFANPIKGFSLVLGYLCHYTSLHFISLFCSQGTKRTVGSTGSPANSHDILWFCMTNEKP